MNDTMDRLSPGDEELRRRLDAYAGARLRPDETATQRTRAVVVSRARKILPAPARRPTPFLRRPLAALLAAAVAMAVLGGGAVAASGPGGPLYGVRLWIEEATLPSDAAARAEAQLGRIETRFREIEAAGAGGDEDALTAALAAYRALVGETMDELQAGARDAHLEAVLSRHLDVLTGLLATAPEPALEGLRNAIEKSGRALDRLHDRTPAASPKPGASPGGPPDPSPPGASPPGGGKPSPKPDASPPGGGKPSPKPDASGESTESSNP